MHLWLHLSIYSLPISRYYRRDAAFEAIQKAERDEAKSKWTQNEELRTKRKFWKILIKKGKCFHYFNWLSKEWTKYSTLRDNYIHVQFLTDDQQIWAVTIRMTSRRQQRDTLSCNSFLPPTGYLQPRYSSPKPHQANPFRKIFHHLISFRSVGLPSLYYFF